MNNSRLCSALWAAACSIIAVWVVLQVGITIVRIGFPWDTYYWPESPFMTNMLKLHNHVPIYGPPGDGNSFVYAPGLEYLCYSTLKPFGLELDIRYCRLVTVVLGILAAVFASLAIGRIAKPANSNSRNWIRFLATFGVAWLVLSKNFMADICHPDNLQAFHAVSVFWLCLCAVETKRFDLGLATMLWAGIGVFSKQTEAVAFLGPAVVFAWFNPWGWRRWLLITGCGALVVAGSMYLLWLPHYARFFTCDLMSHQGIHLLKSARAALDMVGWDRGLGRLVLDRGLLLLLAAGAAFFLWNAGANSRNYLVCWMVVGFFSVMPNMAAYLKTMGTYNNLILFELWFIMIAWPVFLKILEEVRLKTRLDPKKAVAFLPRFAVPQCLVMIALLLLLIPSERVPVPAQYDYCRKIEASVRQDLQAGRRVLVSHGTEYLIRAGMKDVPLDRCNSILELNMAGLGALAETQSRIRGHYYDRIYLVFPGWYGGEIADEIQKDYAQESVIKGPKTELRFDQGFGGGMMDDCVVMIPRAPAAAL